MCLGIPGEIVSIDAGAQGAQGANDGALVMGQVRFGGATKAVCLAYVPDASVGDFVVVHAGFAISKMDRAAADRVFSYLDGIGGPP
jgi:hydrogenase expression/formation protein HypC